MTVWLKLVNAAILCVGRAQRLPPKSCFDGVWIFEADFLLGATNWFARVASPSNPAGAPSRS
eukprot:6069503-Amphidinium_carterae.1